MPTLDEVQDTLTALVTQRMNEAEDAGDSMLHASFELHGVLGSVTVGLLASTLRAYFNSHDERITALDNRLANVEQVIVKGVGATLAGMRDESDDQPEEGG